MTDRVSTLLDGRRRALERALGRSLTPPFHEHVRPLTPEERRHLLEDGEELYWNELEWENITGEEQLDDGSLTELAFPGFLAFIRGLLLEEAMPDSLAPAQPRPEVVEELLRFLSGRVLELEDELSSPAPERERARSELHMTYRLIDLVLQSYLGVEPGETEPQGGFAGH